MGACFPQHCRLFNAVDTRQWRAFGVKLGDKRIGGGSQAHQHTGAVIADIAREFEKLCQLPDEWPESNTLYFAANA